MIPQGVLAEMFGFVDIAAQNKIDKSERRTWVRSQSRWGQDRVPGLEHVASLQHRLRLLQCAPTDAYPPQAAKHARQENLRDRVAVVEHLCGFFKCADSFEEAALK